MSEAYSKDNPGQGSKPSGPWVPPTAEELHQILPQYEIVKMLGRGGMGAVYMGKQTALDRPVAIKILSAALEDSDAGFAERFKNEARAMAKLNHPGMVKVFDFGEAPGGLLYIVMEYVEGTDVAKMIAGKGRLHTEHAMAITAHVCDALAYAHERGIIHRDIKPANVMVGYDGTVKVADFGLAKVNVGGNTLGLTQSGMAMGTLHYMAPEALMLGTAVDHRADIYAVGVMLFQMLTGKLPHGMFKMPSQQVAGLDPRLDSVIAKAIMEDREARYQTAREMRGGLDGILTQPVVKAEPPDTTGAPPAAPVLPTQARPQRPAGSPPVRQVPPRPLPAPVRSSSELGWLAGVVALVGLGAWFYLRGDLSKPGVPDVPPPAQVGPSAAVLPSPTRESKDRPFMNTLGMPFVPVPGTDVLFCVHETRRKDYEAYASATAGVDEAWKDLSIDGFTVSERADEHAVWRVSWHDAQAFCQWLGRKEGKTYRLPTDAEWSVAVGLADQEQRSPTDTPQSLGTKGVRGQFPWGTTWPPRQVVGNYSDDSRWAKAPRKGDTRLNDYNDTWPTTAPVMSFQPNLLGLYDMGGNVWEWLEDSWGSKELNRKALRGASWGTGDHDGLVSSCRAKHPPETRYSTVGFRCVLVVRTPQPAAAPDVLKTPVPEAPATVQASAAPKTLPPPGRANSLGMRFAPIPGTQTWMCIHETRRMDYAKFAEETPGLDSRWMNPDQNGTPLNQGEDHPVTSISWNHAKAFCDWLSKKEQRRYRLPTDREWSIAVGIADLETDADATPEELGRRNTNVFPWGRQWPPPAGAGNFADESNSAVFKKTYVTGYRDGFGTTSPVMSFPPNALGFYDLCGNLWEYCEDWVNEKKEQVVLRGGHYSDYKPHYLSASCRADRHRPTAYSCDGFRVVLVEEPQTAATSPGTALPPRPLPATPAATATIWVDDKGRSLKAAFMGIEGGQVQLNIAGKTTPVALATLSAASQQVAHDLQAALRSRPATTVGTLARATKKAPFTNSLGMIFVPIPDTALLMCVHETRRKDYAAYVSAMSVTDSSWKSQSEGGVPAGHLDDHPVVGVSWEDAVAFCRWLTKLEGATCRLPTDGEWSAAIGIGQKEMELGQVPPASKRHVVRDKFPWRGVFPPSTKVGNYADASLNQVVPSRPIINGYNDGFGTTAPVMSFRANENGLYDLGGNVWEWVEDWWDEARSTKVLRGGCYLNFDESGLLSSERDRRPPSARGESHGFRVVIDLSATSGAAAPGSSR